MDDFLIPELIPQLVPGRSGKRYRLPDDPDWPPTNPRSRAEYNAYINTISGQVPITNRIGDQPNTSIQIVLQNSPDQGGVMWGSPYAANHMITTDSRLERVVQHALPTVDDVTKQFNGVNRVVLTVSEITRQQSGFLSVSRNGYTSGAWSTGWDSIRLLSLIYFDDDTGMHRVLLPQ